MTLKAVLFGSIGTLVETSSLQLNAFNAAFEKAGLDWKWDRETYARLLQKPGGRQRIEAYAASVGDDVNADDLHRCKTQLFNDMMKRDGLTLRSGVREVLAWAKNSGRKVALASTTERRNIDAIIQSTPDISYATFDFLGDRTTVEKEKPAPEIFLLALDTLGIVASEAIAIEDTHACFKSAAAAGIPTIAFPNEFADKDGYDGALTVAKTLAPELFEPVTV